MAVKKLFSVLALTLALLSYWLYCPVPDGYSPKSTGTIRLVLATLKLINGLRHILPKQNYVDLNRFITSSIINLHPGESPDIKETDHVFDGVPVRIYEPASRTGVLPGFVWYHGGGWVFGSIAGSAETARRLSRLTNSVVVSVGYRLAPEHIFPTPFQDSVVATKFFIANAAQFKVDPHRVAVGGDSAGGNLAAAVALKLRDESFSPPVRTQILVYPCLQNVNFRLPSMLKNADGPLLTRSGMAFYASLYLTGNDAYVTPMLTNEHIFSTDAVLPFVNSSKLPAKYLAGDRVESSSVGDETIWNKLKDRLLDGYASPLMARHLGGLPSAYVFTAEHDVLRDDGILYAERLREAGVDVTHRNTDIGFHGIISFADHVPEAAEMFDDLVKFVVNNL